MRPILPSWEMDKLLAALSCIPCGGHGKVCSACGTAVRPGITNCANKACRKPLEKYRPVKCPACQGAGSRKGVKW